MNGTSKGLIGVYKSSTPINSIFQGEKLVWGLKKPIVLSGLCGKFLDNSTESSWWYYANGAANNANKTTLEVDSTTKLFSMDVELEGNCGFMFFDNSKLERIDNMPITNKVTNVNKMFYYASNLTSVNASNWDLSNMTNMSNLFSDCNNLTSVDVSGWDLSNAPYIFGMFYGCKKLASLDLSSWDTSKITSLNTMFHNCESLTTLDISNFNTEKVTAWCSAFYGCMSLHTLMINDLNLIGVKSSDTPFAYCNSLANVEGNIYGIKDSISLQWCPLTNDSAMVFINGLEEVTTSKTITFKASTYNTLTDEQKAIATSKGWTIASN